MNREAFKALPRAGSSSRSASRTDHDDGQLEHTKQSESKRPKRSEGASSYTFPTRRISVLSKRPSRRSMVLTLVGGRTRVSDMNADEGSPHDAGSNTTLPARIQTRSRPPCPLLAEQERCPGSLGSLASRTTL